MRISDWSSDVCSSDLAGGRGFIVGDLFGRSEASEMATAFGGRPAEAGDLNALVQNYWGGYVALRPSARGIELFRDPSGALPAYYVGRDEGWYVASDAPFLVEAGLYAPKIDRSEEHTSEFQSLMPNSSDRFGSTKKK